MLDPVLWLEYAMNVIMEVTKEDALFVEVLESVMLIIAKSVLFKKKTETDVLR